MPQLEHGAPVVPHAAADVPGMHVLPAQHPAQLAEPHPPPTVQTWFWQLSPLKVLHASHAAPPWPQALVKVPGWQTPPVQQPAQVVVPQAPPPPPEHTPPVQVCPAAQAVHAAPFAPHWLTEGTKHSPVDEQHP